MIFFDFLKVKSFSKIKTERGTFRKAVIIFGRMYQIQFTLPLFYIIKVNI